MEARNGCVNMGVASSTLRRRGLSISVAGMGRVWQWCTVAVIDDVIAALISAGIAVDEISWCQAICWAQSSALTTHSELWITIWAALRFGDFCWGGAVLGVSSRSTPDTASASGPGAEWRTSRSYAHGSSWHGCLPHAHALGFCSLRGLMQCLPGRPSLLAFYL